MLIGEDRKAVIENIKKFAESGQFHNKVELNDPVLTPEQSKKITDDYIENRKRLSFKILWPCTRKTFYSRYFRWAPAHEPTSWKPSGINCF